MYCQCLVCGPLDTFPRSTVQTLTDCMSRTLVCRPCDTAKAPAIPRHVRAPVTTEPLNGWKAALPDQKLSKVFRMANAHHVLAAGLHLRPPAALVLHQRTKMFHESPVLLQEEGAETNLHRSRLGTLCILPPRLICTQLSFV